MNSIPKSFVTLPPDCLCQVFASLSITDLAIAKCVCSIWESIGKSPYLLAKVCQECIFIPPYRKIVEGACIEDQERLDAYRVLPNNLLHTLTAPCPRDSTKPIFKTHFLLYIPSQDDMPTQDTFLEVQENNGKNNVEAISDLLKQQKVAQSYWILATKKPFKLPPTGRACKSAQKLVKKACKARILSYDFPTGLEGLALASASRALPYFESISAVFCKSNVQGRHFFVNINRESVSLNVTDCDGPYHTNSCTMGIHKLTTVPLAADLLEKVVQEPVGGNHFDTLPLEIKKCIFSEIPEEEYVRCSLISKHFFDSQWRDYLKHTTLALSGSLYLQSRTYALLFCKFFMENTSLKKQFEWRSKNAERDSIACINVVTDKPKSLFGKMALFKDFLPSLQNAWAKDLDFFCGDGPYNLKSGALADTALRLLLDVSWAARQISICDCVANRHIQDETIESLLERFKNLFSDFDLFRAFDSAILQSRSINLVKAILKQTELTQEKLSKYYQRNHFYKGGMKQADYHAIKYALDKKIPAAYLACIIDKIDYASLLDLHQAITCKLPPDLVKQLRSKISLGDATFSNLRLAIACELPLELIQQLSEKIYFSNQVADGKELNSLFIKCIEAKSEPLVSYFMDHFKGLLPIDDLALYHLFYKNFSDSIIEKALLSLPPSRGLVLNYCSAKKDQILSERILGQLLDIEESALPASIDFKFKDYSEQINFRVYRQLDRQAACLLGKDLLKIALERNYAEEFILFIIDSLPELPFEQLKIAAQKDYSPQVIVSMQAKVPLSSCSII